MSGESRGVSKINGRAPNQSSSSTEGSVRCPEETRIPSGVGPPGGPQQARLWFASRISYIPRVSCESAARFRIRVRNLSERRQIARLRRPSLLFAQLAVIAATMPIATTGIALIMYAFALKTALCRVERNSQPDASSLCILLSGSSPRIK